MRLYFILFLAGFLMITAYSFSQSSEQVTRPIYPKTTGYLSFLLPIITANTDKVTSNFSNFKNGFAIGFPAGINILYSDKFGFSFEITPTIQTGNGSSKTSKLQFAPGPMFRFKHGFAIISRIAFETTGRYGVTPIFNKIIARTKAINYFIAGSLPIKFGNSELPSVTPCIQFGCIFN